MAQRSKKPKTSSKSKSTRSTKPGKTRSPGRKATPKRAPARAASSRGTRAKAAKTPVKKPAARVARKISKPAKPIQLYFWPTPNGHKIAIMLEECRLPYEIIPVNIAIGDQFKPDFLKISPNNRMPAIIDPSGPGGRALSIFESGAILRYLAWKSGKFYADDPRGQAKVDEWLFWQVGNLGPMAGQAHHFREYAPEPLPYAIERYTNECNRLYGVMERGLSSGQKFLAGRYSIADMAAYPWVAPYALQGQSLDEFPLVRAWFERVGARPAVKRGLKVGLALREQSRDLKTDEEARRVLFNQRATAA